MHRKLTSLVLSVAIALTVACSASAVKTEYVALGVTVHSVDLAMTVWGQYVRNGSAKPGEEDKVRGAYQKYQDAIVVAKAGLALSDNSETPADLAAAANALIDIVQSITKKKVS